MITRQFVTRTALFVGVLLVATNSWAQGADSPITLKVASGAIEGTLRLPGATGKVPVALIIAGSGPTDRDGNSPLLPGKNNAYLMIATALADKGVASVRYDKRGIAASRAAGGTSESALRFDMYVDDAVAWIEQLRGDPRFSRVIVIGHSEGSLIGMVAARKGKADAYVSIAGASKPAGQILRDQLRPQLTAVPQLWQESDGVLTSLEAAKTVDPLPAGIATIPNLASLFRPSVQPYLISWFAYNPSAEIAKLAIPVLILQGTNDIQVAPDEAKALMAAKPDATLAIIDGMNHVLKIAPADRAQNVATYGNPDLPLAPEFVKALMAFVKK
jgi:pimeloyl-ACP methyl ester carboxylesterase